MKIIASSGGVLYYEDETSRRKIKTSYNDIFDYLNGLLEEKKISLYQYSLITDVLKKVTDNLAQKNEEARKELDELMGGKILKFKNEELFDEQQFHDIETLMETAHMTPEQAMDALRVSSDKRPIYLKKLSKKKELVEV